MCLKSKQGINEPYSFQDIFKILKVTPVLMRSEKKLTPEITARFLHVCCQLLHKYLKTLSVCNLLAIYSREENNSVQFGFIPRLKL